MTFIAVDKCIKGPKTVAGRYIKEVLLLMFEEQQRERSCNFASGIPGYYIFGGGWNETLHDL